jgi:uncharacterized membrane protein YphA (DoxX/SURF4 family)
LLNLPASGRLVSAIRVVLASVFLVTGVAKIPILSSVAATIDQLVPLGPVVSFICAVFLVVTELGVGALMLVGVGVVYAARIGAMLVSGFLVVLASALYRGAELRCNCFGFLGVSPSNQLEFIFDVFLFGGFILAACHAGDRGKRVSGVIWPVTAAAAVTLLVVTIGGSRSAVLPDQRRYGAFLQRAESEGLLSRDVMPGNRLLLLVDLRELQCAICYEDFVALCDSLSSPRRVGLFARTVVVVRNALERRDRWREAMMRWARETGIAGPIVILPEEEFDQMSGGKNVAAVVDRYGSVVREADLPMGEALRNVLLANLEGS